MTERKQKIFAVYDGDVFKAVGNAKEIAKQMGWQRTTKIYEHLSLQKNGKHPHKRIQVIELKEEEEDEL